MQVALSSTINCDMLKIQRTGYCYNNGALEFLEFCAQVSFVAFDESPLLPTSETPADCPHFICFLDNYLTAKTIKMQFLLKWSEIEGYLSEK